METPRAKKNKLLNEMKYLLVINLIFFGNICYAQTKYDAQWILGQRADVNIDFNSSSADILSRSYANEFSLASSNVSMSDSLGNLLFYSNGREIRDRFDNIMLNGESINPGIVEQFYSDNPIPQGTLTLPMPGHPEKYYVFNQDLDIVIYEPDDYSTLDPKRILYSIVDMTQNGGLGAVISKNNVLVEDSLALVRGQLTAVRHANGKDWWIMSPQAQSNCYYLSLLTDEGIDDNQLFCSGKQWTREHGIGQAVFSPDGTKYARFNPRNGLHIFDFDRCIGELSNPISIDFSDDTFGAAGLSISPNSRFLYTAARTKLYQFDLDASNVPQSRILIDTLNLLNTPSFSAVFYLSQLAPDNKIYIAGISSHLFLHVINEPDSLGVACNFAQQAIEIPALNFASIPNFPNFRLGAANEICDPNSTTSTSTINESFEFTLFPNPASDYLFVDFENDNYDLSACNLTLFDMIGNMVMFTKNLVTNTRINISSVPPGTYFFQLRRKGEILKTKKMIVMKP